MFSLTQFVAVIFEATTSADLLAGTQTDYSEALFAIVQNENESLDDFTIRAEERFQYWKTLTWGDVDPVYAKGGSFSPKKSDLYYEGDLSMRIINREI